MQWTVGIVTFMEGQAGHGVIVHCNDGYFYHRHHDEDRIESPYITLRCRHRRRQVNPCMGSAYMSRNGQHFHCTQFHNHAPDRWFVEEQVLRRSILQAISSGDPSPFSVIIRNVGLRGGFSAEARSRLTLARLRTALREERNRFLPDIPDTLQQLGLFLQEPRYHHVTDTMDGEDNIFAGVCGDFAAQTYSVVFMSLRQSTFLENSRLVFSDGTFKKRAKKPQSNQIFVLSCVWYNQQTSNKHIITCARIFMQRRTYEAYHTLIQFLKVLMPTWYPVDIMCDHELGQVNAWAASFPNARISTCLFHFAVDVFRNAKSIGLHQLMLDTWEVATVVRCCAVLPLLPQHMFVQGLYAIGYWAVHMGVMDFPGVRTLFQYVERQWIPAQAYLSVYAMNDRTNNVSESVNATLALEIREDRPNIWILLGAFKRLEDQTNVDLHALQRGRNAGRVQQLRTLRNDVRVLNLTDSLMRGNISIMTFLLEASSCVEAPLQHVFH